MDKLEFTKGITIINSVCQKQLETDDTLTIYYELLKDLNVNDYLNAILEIIKEKEFLHSPISPAEIRNKVKYMKKVNLKALDVLDKIKIDIIKYGALRKPTYPIEIEQTIESIGGWGKLCSVDEEKLVFIEKEFVKNYKTPLFIENKVKEIK